MNNLRLETNGTNKHVKVFAPNGDEIGGIIKVELPPIDRESDGRVTITCYLEGSPFAKQPVSSRSSQDNRPTGMPFPTKAGIYQFRGEHDCERTFVDPYPKKLKDWTEVIVFGDESKPNGLFARFGNYAGGNASMFRGEWRVKPPFTPIAM